MTAAAEVRDDILKSDASRISATAARVAIAAGAAQVLSLLSLHVLSPEFDPAWRVVSEYAHGRYAWVLSMMCAFGAICVWSLAFAIRSQIQTTGGTIGWALLVATGLGTAFASIFDIDHPLHELCGMVGILGHTAAAVLLSISLGRTQPWSQMRGALLWSANLTWISVVVFAITMAIFIVTYTRTGASTTTPIPVGAPLPDGVIGINGWTNRVLLIPFWALTVAWCALRLRQRADRKGC